MNGWKWIVVVLALANIALFGALQLGSEGGEAGPAREALHADKIRLLGIHQAASAATRSQGDGKGQPGAVARTQAVCLEWGSFVAGDLARVRQALGALSLGERLSERGIETGGFRVYIPPVASQPLAQKKLNELKTLGVQDYQFMQDAGKWQYAISLGVFPTGEAAAKRLAELRAAGVKSAKSAPREEESRVSFVVRNADDAVMAKLVALKQGFPGSDVQAVECK
jgi:hypothetical protein